MMVNRKNKLVSVIMLTYKREKYVRNMIEDIIQQSYTNFEFIIIDNGSTDKSGFIAEEYKKKDNRIKVVHLQTPHSIGFARNYGVRLSCGSYIAFVDDDDRADRDYLSFLIDLLEENDADISMCGASEGDGATRIPQCIFNEKLVVSGREAVKMLINRKYIRAGTPTKLYKRNILEMYPFVENYRNEDIHTQYKYLLASKKVVLQGKDHYYYTRHAGNVSGFTSDDSKWNYSTMRDYLDAYRNRTEFIGKNATEIYEVALYSEWSFMISMIDKIDRYNLTECRELDDKMRKLLGENREKFLSMPYIKDFEKQWMCKYLLK